MGTVRTPESTGVSSCLGFFDEQDSEGSSVSLHLAMSPKQASKPVAHTQERNSSIPDAIAPLQVVSVLNKMTDSLELCCELEKRCSSTIPELRYLSACYIAPQSGSCLEAFHGLNADQEWNVERFVVWRCDAQRHLILKDWLMKQDAGKSTLHARRTHKAGSFEFVTRRLSNILNAFSSTK